LNDHHDQPVDAVGSVLFALWLISTAMYLTGLLAHSVAAIWRAYGAAPGVIALVLAATGGLALLGRGIAHEHEQRQ
jgi:ethanolamine transporter EutH